MSNVDFEITQELGILSTTPKGWTKELNLVSWNGKEPKYDLREWSPNHERPGKGVVLSVEEISKLQELLNKLSD